MQLNNRRKILALLSEIRRGLNLFTDLEVDFELSYSPEQFGFNSYINRLDKALPTLLPRLSRRPLSHSLPGYKGVVVEDEEIGRGITEIRIYPTSPLFPNKSEDPGTYKFLSHLHFDLLFYKSPPRDHRFDPYAPPDLLIAVDVPITKISIRYELAAKRISVSADDIRLVERHWQGSGKIVSLLDLAGAELVFDIAQATRNIENPPALNSVALAIAKRYQWQWYSEEDRYYKFAGYGIGGLMKVCPEGNYLYCYEFPKSYEQIVSELEFHGQD
jgi:hypothetical protein